MNLQLFLKIVRNPNPNKQREINAFELKFEMKVDIYF